MRMKFEVTGITAITDARLLVQLTGESGNIQLNLPRSEQAKLRVGQEFVLSAIDEATSAVDGVTPARRIRRAIDVQD